MPTYLRDSLTTIMRKCLNNKNTSNEIYDVTTEIINIIRNNKYIVAISDLFEKEGVKTNEIIYYIKDKNYVIFHTKSKSFKFKLDKNTDIDELILSNEFLVIEKHKVVNVSHIKKYDSYMFLLYFDDCIDQNCERLAVTHKAISVIRKILIGNEYDVRTDKHIEYFPNKKKRVPSSYFDY